MTHPNQYQGKDPFGRTITKKPSQHEPKPVSRVERSPKQEKKS